MSRYRAWRMPEAIRAKEKEGRLRTIWGQRAPSARILPSELPPPSAKTAGKVYVMPDGRWYRYPDQKVNGKWPKPVRTMPRKKGMSPGLHDLEKDTSKTTWGSYQTRLDRKKSLSGLPKSDLKQTPREEDIIRTIPGGETGMPLNEEAYAEKVRRGILPKPMTTYTPPSREKELVDVMTRINQGQGGAQAGKAPPGEAIRKPYGASGTSGTATPTGGTGQVTRRPRSSLWAGLSEAERAALLEKLREQQSGRMVDRSGRTTRTRRGDRAFSREAAGRVHRTRRQQPPPDGENPPPGESDDGSIVKPEPEPEPSPDRSEKPTDWESLFENIPPSEQQRWREFVDALKNYGMEDWQIYEQLKKNIDYNYKGWKPGDPWPPEQGGGETPPPSEETPPPSEETPPPSEQGGGEQPPAEGGGASPGMSIVDTGQQAAEEGNYIVPPTMNPVETVVKSPELGRYELRGDYWYKVGYGEGPQTIPATQGKDFAAAYQNWYANRSVYGGLSDYYQWPKPEGGPFQSLFPKQRQEPFMQTAREELSSIPRGHIRNKEWFRKYRRWADFYRTAAEQALGLQEGRPAFDPLAQLQQKLQEGYSPTWIQDIFNPLRPGVKPAAWQQQYTPTYPENITVDTLWERPETDQSSERQGIPQRGSVAGTGAEGGEGGGTTSTPAPTEGQSQMDFYNPENAEIFKFEDLWPEGAPTRNELWDFFKAHPNAVVIGTNPNRVIIGRQFVEEQYNALKEQGYNPELPWEQQDRLSDIFDEWARLHPDEASAPPINWQPEPETPLSRRYTDQELINDLLTARQRGITTQLQQRQAQMGAPGVYSGLMAAQERARQALTEQATAAYKPLKWAFQQQAQQQMGQLLQAVNAPQLEAQRLIGFAGRAM